MGRMAVRRELVPERRDPFPWCVTLGCLVLGGALFVHSTTPALAERELLEKAEAEQVEALEGARAELVDLRQRRARLDHHPGAILVEIDAHGTTPERAVELHGPRR